MKITRRLRAQVEIADEIADEIAGRGEHQTVPAAGPFVLSRLEHFVGTPSSSLRT